MTAVYVENVARVVTNLYSFSDETREILKGVLRRIADRINVRATVQFASHARSGRLVSSLRTTVKEYGDNRGGAFAYKRVSASVVAGGRRNVRYAHAFERGFDADVQVPAHTRTSRFGKRFDVKAYNLHHKVKRHGYLGNALEAEAANAPAEIAMAIGAHAQRKGLA